MEKKIKVLSFPTCAIKPYLEIKTKVTAGIFCIFQYSSPRHHFPFRVHPFLQAPFRGSGKEVN